MNKKPIENTIVARLMKVQDIEASTQVHLRAFKGYMNASLGENYSRSFLNWFITNDIATSWVVAEGNEVLGYIVGASIGYDSVLNKALLKTGILSILSHPTILFHTHFVETIKSRLRLLLSPQKVITEVSNEPAGMGISLVGIAVDPRNTKKGVGTILMQTFEQHAKQAGYNYMRLSVYEVNNQARKLYSKSGWKLLKTEGPVLYYYKEI
jgi:ribosomal protein S18 acetylase RimI-like enzyme